MYRALNRLHQHVETRTENQELDLPIIQKLTWEFLCDPERCSKQQGLNLLKLCPIGLNTKNKVTCGHCRFRKTFFIFKALARAKARSKDQRAKRITDMLQVNSEAIVKFCFERIEEKWGKNCVSESQTRERSTFNSISSSKVPEFELGQGSSRCWYQHQRLVPTLVPIGQV